METRYDLIFEGKISDNCSPEDARRNLAKLLRRELNEIEALFSGKPFFLRRALDAETAYRFLGAMKHAGLVCRLVQTNEVSPAIRAQPVPATPAPIAPAPPKAKLELAKPKLELAPADDPPAAPPAPAAPVPTPPAVFSECPKCRYRARGPQDGLISQGVCPACGLIIAKYLQLQAERNRPKAPAPRTASALSGPMQSNDIEFEELRNGLLKFMSLEFTLPPDIALPDHPQHAPTASLKRRFLAGVATYLSVSFLTALPILLSKIVLLLLLNPALSAASDFSAAIETVKNFATYERIAAVGFWLFGMWMGFFYLPGKWDGLTYGQRLMRIAPVRLDSDDVVLPNTAILLQRLVGNVVAFFTWPVTLILVMFDHGWRSFADRLSDCRQIEVGDAPDSPATKTFAPLAYGLAVGLLTAVAIVPLTNWAGDTLAQKRAAPQTDRFAAREKLLIDPNNPQFRIGKSDAGVNPRENEQRWTTQNPKALLEQLVELEHQYFARHQRYSDAIEEIFMESPDWQSPRSLAMLMQQQQMRKLDIQLMTDGFKIGLRRDDGWHIATEEGYQGVRPSF